MSAERCCMIIDATPLVRQGIKRQLEPDWEFEELTDGRGAVDLLNSVGRIEVAIVEMRPAGSGVPVGNEDDQGAARGAARPRGGRPRRTGRAPRGRRGDRRGRRPPTSASARRPARSAPPSSRCSTQQSYIDPELDHLIDRAITPRQRQILQLFADGHSTEDAARRLGLSAETVRTHAKASLPRLGARDRLTR